MDRTCKPSELPLISPLQQNNSSTVVKKKFASMSRFKDTDALKAIWKQEYSTGKKPISALSGKAHNLKKMCRMCQSTIEQADGRLPHRF